MNSRHFLLSCDPFWWSGNFWDTIGPSRSVCIRRARGGGRSWPPWPPLVPPALSRVGQTFHIAQLSVFCKKGGKNRDLATPSGIHEWKHVALQKNGWQTTNWIEKNSKCQIHISAPTLRENTAQKTAKSIYKLIPKRSIQINYNVMFVLYQCEIFGVWLFASATIRDSHFSIINIIFR